MGLITLTALSNGTPADATVVNSNFTTLSNEFNGNIDDNNIKPSANINGTKLLAASLSASKIAAEVYGVWSPNSGGVTTPQVTAYAQYYQIGKMVHAYFESGGSGTSSSATKTITLPVAPKYTTSFLCTNGKDNGVILTSPPQLVTRAASGTADVFKDISGANWTAGNSAYYFSFNIVYEAL